MKMGHRPENILDSLGPRNRLSWHQHHSYFNLFVVAHFVIPLFLSSVPCNAALTYVAVNSGAAQSSQLILYCYNSPRGTTIHTQTYQSQQQKRKAAQPLQHRRHQQRPIHIYLYGINSSNTKYKLSTIMLTFSCVFSRHESKMARRSIFVLILLQITSIALCCNCPDGKPMGLQDAYFSNETERIVRATPVTRTTMNETSGPPKVIYVFKVRKIFKGCPISSKFIILSTSDSSLDSLGTQCAIEFDLKQKYILALPTGSTDSVATVSSCSVS